MACHHDFVPLGLDEFCQYEAKTFLEEVSSILNTEEVPNSYSNEDKMEIMELCAKSASALPAWVPLGVWLALVRVTFVRARAV